MITKENNFEYLFCMQKTRPKKEDQIDKKKNKEKVGLQSFFSFPTMLKQLTLFRKILGQIEPYFRKPQSMYEQCVNKSWKLNHEKYG